MLDNDQIRHRNARLLVAKLEREAGKHGARAGGVAMLARRLRKGAPQVQHFAGKNPIKSIGKQLAREIETAFGLEYGWMDWPHEDDEASQSLRLDPDTLGAAIRMFRAMERTAGREYALDDMQNDPETFVEGYRHFIEMGGPAVHKQQAEQPPQGARNNGGRVHDKTGSGPARKKVGAGGSRGA
jgi:hypothetical protein